MISRPALSAMMALSLLASALRAVADEPVSRTTASLPVSANAAPEGINSHPPGTLRRGGGRRLLADDSAASARPASPGSNAGGARTLGLAWPLIAVLGVITLLALAARRWLPRTNLSAAHGPVQVLGRHYLSSKQSLCLVRVGGRVLLLGVTPEHIESLSVVEDAAEASAILATAERGRPGSFSSALSRLAPAPSEARWDDEQAPVAARLTEAGGSVRSLLERVRAISQKEASAEPA